MMRVYKHAVERRAARMARRAAEIEALVELALDQAEWERTQELHEELCALWRGRCRRAYEWALSARQLRHEVELTWWRALKWRATAKRTGRWTTQDAERFVETARWCVEKLALASRQEREAEEAAEAWYREAIQDLD